MNRRISALEASVSDLAKSNAVLAAQTKPIVEWVQSQMTNGLARRMDTLDEDLSDVKSDMVGMKTGMSEINKGLQGVRMTMRLMAAKVVGASAALLFIWGLFWGIYGDSIKRGVLGK